MGYPAFGPFLRSHDMHSDALAKDKLVFTIGAVVLEIRVLDRPVS